VPAQFGQYVLQQGIVGLRTGEWREEAEQQK